MFLSLKHCYISIDVTFIKSLLSLSFLLLITESLSDQVVNIPVGCDPPVMSCLPKAPPPTPTFQVYIALIDFSLSTKWLSSSANSPITSSSKTWIWYSHGPP